MQWNWLDLNFPWLGLAAAVLLLGFLFLTDTLRSDTTRSRWRDRTWLAWLAVALYLAHNVEEYGVDLLGQSHAFPSAMCVTLGQSPYPLCPFPPAFFLAVNLPLFWLLAPVMALMSRRHPLFALSLYGVIFINGLAHVAELLRSGYNPGAFTALVLFLPISLWVAHAFFGKHALPYRGLALIVASGVLLHLILIGSALLFLHHAIGSATLVASQIVNAALLCVIALVGEKFLLKGKPVAG